LSFRSSLAGNFAIFFFRFLSYLLAYFSLASPLSLVKLKWEKWGV
jgi:hypothetical protein